MTNKERSTLINFLAENPEVREAYKKNHQSKYTPENSPNGYYSELGDEEDILSIIRSLEDFNFSGEI